MLLLLLRCCVCGVVLCLFLYVCMFLFCVVLLMLLCVVVVCCIVVSSGSHSRLSAMFVMRVECSCVCGVLVLLLLGV